MLKGSWHFCSLPSIQIPVIHCEVNDEDPLDLDLVADHHRLLNDFVDCDQDGAVCERCVRTFLRVKGAEASVKPSIPTEVTMATPKASFFIPTIFMSMPQVEVRNVINFSRMESINVGRNFAGPVLFLCMASPPLDDLIPEVLLLM